MDFLKKPNWIYAMFENIRIKKILGCTLGTIKELFQKMITKNIGNETSNL